MNAEIRDHFAWLYGAVHDQLGVTSDAAPSNLGRGTTFPTSPADHDRFFRTDRHLEYFWNAAIGRWPTTTLYQVPMPNYDALSPTSVGGVLGRLAPPSGDMWIEAWHGFYFIHAPSDGTHFYQIDLRADGTVLGSVWTATATPDAITAFSALTSPGLLGSFSILSESIVGVSDAPGGATMVGYVDYRLIG